MGAPEKNFRKGKMKSEIGNLIVENTKQAMSLSIILRFTITNQQCRDQFDSQYQLLFQKEL